MNKKSGRAWLSDGNHRVAAIIRLGVEWVPIHLEYRYVDKGNGNELFHPPVPTFFVGIDDWSKYPTASELGFTTDFFDQHIRQKSISKSISITRWSAHKKESKDSKTSKIQKEVNISCNRKVALHKGDPFVLDVDCLVCDIDDPLVHKKAGS